MMKSDIVRLGAQVGVLISVCILFRFRDTPAASSAPDFTGNALPALIN